MWFCSICFKWVLTSKIWTRVTKKWNDMVNISTKPKHFDRTNKTFNDSTKIYNSSKAMVGYFQFINFIVTLRSKCFYWNPRKVIVFQSSRKYKLKSLTENKKTHRIATRTNWKPFIVSGRGQIMEDTNFW